MKVRVQVVCEAPPRLQQLLRIVLECRPQRVRVLGQRDLDPLLTLDLGGHPPVVVGDRGDRPRRVQWLQVEGRTQPR